MKIPSPEWVKYYSQGCSEAEPLVKKEHLDCI
jgi:hypothetical protein